MEPIQARLISKGKGGKTAEVVSYLGEGIRRRSVTSHLQLVQGKWLGHNPDEAAVARLNTAEELERAGKTAVAYFNRELKRVQDNILALKERKPEMDGQEYIKARRKLGKQNKEATAQLAKATGISEAAKKAADEVRSNVERMPEFVF